MSQSSCPTLACPTSFTSLQNRYFLPSPRFLVICTVLPYFTHLSDYVLFFFFWAGLEFELRALPLLGRHSTT
jgi:hypothetical protein